MGKEKILITNIQRFSLHDGPGIRTTVFLKGCQLRCPWCCNPETIIYEMQKYEKNGILGIYGKYYSIDDIFREVMKDKAFYVGGTENYNIKSLNELQKLPGGITFSGGECLLQMDKLEELLKKIHEEHIHIAVETSLFSNQQQLEIALKYIDLFYVDIKILDKEECKKILHGDLKVYFGNYELLMNSGIPVIIRIPVIGGFTDTEKNKRQVFSLLNRSRGNILKIELLKEHNLGLTKYQALVNGGNEIAIPDYKGVTDDTMNLYKKALDGFCKVPVTICEEKFSA